MGIAQYRLCQRRGGRLFEGHILHEGTDGGKAGVSAANAVMAIPLKVVEEIENERCAQLLDGDITGLLVQLSMGKSEQ
jgi:hypothetical protein